MPLFHNMLASGESLFRNEEALDFSFQPKPMRYREEQQRYMAGCISPLLESRNGKNLFIYGIPGIGKTMACSQLAEELEETTDKIAPLYVNCWHKNTSFKVYLELCELLGYAFTQNKKGDELFKVIKEILNRKSAVFIFDEIDKAEDLDFLYLIAEGIYRRSVFLVTNYQSWLNSLEERIKSRLMISQLEFRPYSYKETEGILRQRIGYAFVPDVLDEDAFQLLLKKTADIGDIRAGLSMLREAGLNAEGKSRRKITLEDAKAALERLAGYNSESPDSLGSELKFVLGIIRGSSVIRMGELFKCYQEKGGGMSYRSLFRNVNKLAEGKFIVLEKRAGGAEGTTTIIKYSENAQEKKTASESADNK